MEFADWRFNLRGSNTEPLVRLNVESRGNEALMQEKTAELLALLDELTVKYRPEQGTGCRERVLRQPGRAPRFPAPYRQE